MSRKFSKQHEYWELLCLTSQAMKVSDNFFGLDSFCWCNKFSYLCLLCPWIWTMVTYAFSLLLECIIVNCDCMFLKEWCENKQLTLFPCLCFFIMVTWPTHHFLFWCRNLAIWPVTLQHNVLQVQLGMIVSNSQVAFNG